MTHDFSNVEVGDKVRFVYEGTVEYIDGVDPIELTLSRGLVLSPEPSENVSELTFTKPPVALPTTPGSIILCTTLDDEVVTPFTLQLRSYDEWCDSDDQDYYDITDYTVLYDAGAAVQ